MSFTREIYEGEVTTHRDVNTTTFANTLLATTEPSEVNSDHKLPNSYMFFNEHGTQFVKTDNTNVKIHTYLLWALPGPYGTFPVTNPPTTMKLSDISNITFSGVVNQLPTDSMFMKIYTTPDFNVMNAWENKTDYSIMFLNVSENAGVLQTFTADISPITSSSNTDSIFAIAFSTNSTSNNIDLVINNVNVTLTNGDEINLTYPKVSPVCFLQGTKITTDQGPCLIENITKEHTIFGGRVNNITESFNYFNYLIHFKPNALKERVPSNDIFVSPTHAIYCPINNILKMAKDFCDGDKIVEDYSKDKTHKIYNVIIEDANGELQSHSMYVNNMLCETLHPHAYPLVRNQLKY